MSVPFSERTRWDRTPNAFTLRLEELRAAGADLVDLTESNPTRCGLSFSDGELNEALDRPGMGTYSPDPFGLASARAAVARHLWRKGAAVDPGQLLLTASTSEAYSFLFQLLCDPGDEVAVFTPGYPLLDYLAQLQSARLRAFPLVAEAGWALDLSELEKAGPRVRAVAVVNPANPTGHFLRRGELQALSSLCAQRGWALIADEVFAPYGLLGEEPGHVPTIVGEELPCLSFALSGLSKLAALPQMKLAWIWIGGPERERAEAAARLEVIADSFLSVSTPVQLAVPRLLSVAPQVQAQIRARVAMNRSRLKSLRPQDAAWDLLPSEGGWCAVVRLPAREDDERLAIELLDRGVAVQPGHFFDFPRSRPALVISLLPERHRFAEGAHRLASALSAR